MVAGIRCVVAVQPGTVFVAIGVVVLKLVMFFVVSRVVMLNLFISHTCYGRRDQVCGRGFISFHS